MDGPLARGSSKDEKLQSALEKGKPGKPASFVLVPNDAGLSTARQSSQHVVLLGENDREALQLVGEGLDV
jgi:hypothetical protein